MQRIVNLIKADKVRLKVLEAVSSLDLPDCYVGAGFVRNLVWDYLHEYTRTKLNDVDVIYYSEQELNDVHLSGKLESIMPKYNWQVKNQAFMHLKNEDEPYVSTVHAMEYWPEIETAVAARLVDNNHIEVIAPFGVESLFSGCITRNPNRSSSIFKNRVKSKGWLVAWPKLTVRL